MTKDRQQAGKDREQNLPDTPWPFALHFTGRGIDKDLVGFVAIFVGQQPDRQQQVLEGDCAVLRIDGVDTLCVATDSIPDVLIECLVDSRSTTSRIRMMT